MTTTEAKESVIEVVSAEQLTSLMPHKRSNSLTDKIRALKAGEALTITNPKKAAHYHSLIRTARIRKRNPIPADNLFSVHGLTNGQIAIIRTA